MSEQISDRLRRNIFIAVVSILIIATVIAIIQGQNGKRLFSFGRDEESVAQYLDESSNEIKLFRQAQAVNDKEGMELHLTKAVERARAAEAMAPDDPRVIEYLGKIFVEASSLSSQALDLAESYYKELSALKPEYVTAYNNLGYILYIKGEKADEVEQREMYYSESLGYYEAALSREPDALTSIYGKAISLDKLGNLDEAILLMERAVEIDAKNQTYAFELGRMYYNRAATASQDDVLEIDNEDIVKALELFNLVIASAPDHANARYSLAVLYQKTGDTEKAREQVDVLLDVVDEGQADDIKKQFSDLY